MLFLGATGTNKAATQVYNDNYVLSRQFHIVMKLKDCQKNSKYQFSQLTSQSVSHSDCHNRKITRTTFPQQLCIRAGSSSLRTKIKAFTFPSSEGPAGKKETR